MIWNIQQYFEFLISNIEEHKFALQDKITSYAQTTRVCFYLYFVSSLCICILQESNYPIVGKIV